MIATNTIRYEYQNTESGSCVELSVHEGMRSLWEIEINDEFEIDTLEIVK
jgi:hypothetical protein